MKVLALALFLSSVSAQAYMPPAFYLYEKLAETRSNPVQATAFQLSLFRMRAGGVEEYLGDITQSLGVKDETNWPGLTMLISNEQGELALSVEKFGLPVIQEQELMIVPKEKLAGIKNLPHPFYKKDPNVFLRRWNQSIAYVHSSKNPKEQDAKSFWLDKETFMPLKFEAPCPLEMKEYDGVLGGFYSSTPENSATDSSKPTTAPTAVNVAAKNHCELEFRNIYGVRRMEFQAARIYIKRDGIALFQVRIEKILTGKNPVSAVSETPSKLDTRTQELISLFLH